jgi:hypothetical protein
MSSHNVDDVDEVVGHSYTNKFNEVILNNRIILLCTLKAQKDAKMAGHLDNDITDGQTRWQKLGLEIWARGDMLIQRVCGY